MLTLAQIAAIIALLQAFGVPSSTIAIVEAELTPPAPTVIVDSQPSQPTFGSTIQTVTQPVDNSAIVVTQHDSDIKNTEHGAFVFEVSVLGPDGNPMKGQAVHFSGQDNSYSDDNSNPNTNRITNAQTYPEVDGRTDREHGQGNWHTSFDYLPTSSGEKILTFTSGSLTKTLTITIQ